jgi:hypothetical protein
MIPTVYHYKIFRFSLVAAFENIVCGILPRFLLVAEYEQIAFFAEVYPLCFYI